MVCDPEFKEEFDKCRRGFQDLLGLDFLSVLHNIASTHFYGDMKIETVNETKLVRMLAQTGFVYACEDDVVAMSEALDKKEEICTDIEIFEEGRISVSIEDDPTTHVWKHHITGVEVSLDESASPSRSLWGRLA